MENINWLGILIGALVPMVMGFIWYHPNVLGNIWMKSIGKTEDDLKKGNLALTLGISFILSALLAFFLTGLFGIHDYITILNEGEGAKYPHSFGHGAFHGGIAAFTIAIPVLVTNSLFEQRNWSNILVNATYWIVTISLMGGVISLFM